MILLDDFWSFVSYRPGLGATGVEWSTVLGNDLWRALRQRLFVGDGIAASCTNTDGNRPLQVVGRNDGYQLVCAATGVVVTDRVTEDDVRCYRLDLSAIRDATAKALGIDSEPGVVRDGPRAFALGEWQPVDGVSLPAYMMFPPTSTSLHAELHRLLLAARDGFILLVPKSPKIGRQTRDLIDQKKATILALNEVVGWDGSAFCSTTSWQTYRDAYCRKHLADRMVPAPPKYLFAKKSAWAIRFAGKETVLDSTLKGPVFIRYLLERQGQEIHVARMLADIASDDRLDRASDAGELVDGKTLKDCRERYDELHEERADAERNRPDQLPEIDAEITQLANYFAECVGLGGKSRKAADDVAKIRKRIARVIEIATAKIEENDAQLASHLRKSIKTHTFMSYEPETPIDWNFE